MAQSDCSANHKPLWTIIVLMLVTIFLSGAFGYGQGEGMKSKNDTQDLRIENVEEDIGEIKDDLKGFRKEQRTFNEALIEELRQLTYEHQPHPE